MGTRCETDPAKADRDFVRLVKAGWHWLVIATAPVLLTWPLALRMNRGFFAWDVPALMKSGVVAGDHLNNVYRFWLFHDASREGRLPFQDPYAFALGGGANDPPLGWIFGPIYSIGHALVGAVNAYNLLVLLGSAEE